MGKPAKKAAVKKEAKPKKPRAPKAPKADPKPASIAAGSNTIDRDRQNLARVHRDKFIRLKAAKTTADRNMRALEKLIKEDGFTKKQIQIMAQLETPEGEAAVKLLVSQTLEAARWQGSEIGNQLDLFMEPDRTPAVDRAYEEGVQDCMDGKSANPGYEPSLPQYARYMEGYHDETERRVKKGFKVKEPEAEGGTTLITAAEKEAKAKEAADWAAATAAANKPVVPSPTPAKPLTKKEAKEQAEAVFAKPDRAEVLAAAREENDGFFDSASTKH